MWGLFFLQWDISCSDLEPPLHSTHNSFWQASKAAWLVSITHGGGALRPQQRQNEWRQANELESKSDWCKSGRRVLPQSAEREGLWTRVHFKKTALPPKRFRFCFMIALVVRHQPPSEYYGCNSNDAIGIPRQTTKSYRVRQINSNVDV